MTKNLLCIVALPFCFSTSWAQMVTNIDYAPLANGIPQTAIASVIANDTYNSAPVENSAVILSQQSSNSNLLALQPDGSVVILEPGLSDGVYWLDYQICLRNDNESCEMGRCTLFVNRCAIAPPQFDDVYFLPCSESGNIAVSGLPAGDWTLRQTRNGVFLSDFTGSGNLAQVPVTQSRLYGFRVLSADGVCESSEQFVTVSEPACTWKAIAQNKGICDTNGNGLSDPGDMVSLKVTVSNAIVQPLENLIVVGFSQLGSTSSPLGGNAVSSKTHVRVLEQADINAGTLSGTTMVIGTYVGQSGGTQQNIPFNIPLATPRGFRLVAFADLNDNGLIDANESTYRDGLFRYTINDGEPHYRYVGGYLYVEDPAALYDFEFSLIDDYQSYYSLSNPTRENLTTGASGIQTLYFPVVPIAPFNDVSVKMYATQTLPGMNSRVQTHVQNRSYLPSSAIGLTFGFTTGDALLHPTIPWPITETPTGFTASLSLSSLNARTYTTLMAIPAIPAVNAGDTVTYSTSITSTPDLIAGNNSVVMSVPVDATYQTNDIYEGLGPEIPIGTFDPDDYLRYTVRYDNMSDVASYNLTITMTLDEQLDENSVRMYLFGDPHVFERVGRVLTWRFPALCRTPFLAGPEGNFGFLQFEVKPRPGFQVGDIITSSAEIVFDLKPALSTNSWQSHFVETLKTDNFISEELKVYPNPVSDRLQIEKDQSIDQIVVYDVLGHQILTQNVQSNVSTVATQAWSPGIYFVKILSQGSGQTVKIIKR